MSRRRDLDPAERALWDTVSRTVRPLSKRPGAAPSRAPKPARPAAEAERHFTARTQARGADEPVDSRLDLHGMTEAEAYRRLLAHLEAAQARGERCVLVITGKGRERRADTVDDKEKTSRTGRHGALRRLVPLWLETPAFAPLVRACRPARPKDGGAGAFHIVLRRR